MPVHVCACVFLYVFDCAFPCMCVCLCSCLCVSLNVCLCVFLCVGACACYCVCAPPPPPMSSRDRVATRESICSLYHLPAHQASLLCNTRGQSHYQTPLHGRIFLHTLPSLFLLSPALPCVLPALSPWSPRPFIRISSLRVFLPALPPSLQRLQSLGDLGSQ